LISASDFVL
jgi:hypothetical protein